MSYENNKNQFISDYNVAAKKANLDTTKIMTADEAYEIYTNSWNVKKESRNFQVFGRHVWKDPQAREIKNQPLWRTMLPGHLVGIGNPEFINFFSNPAPVSDAQPGSVLWGHVKWSVTVNDAWLLGGVHSGQEFRAASPINRRNLYNKEYILSVMGRELVGLLLAGYKERRERFTSGSSHHQRSFTANKLSWDQKGQLSLVQYQEEISKITLHEFRARQFFKDHGIKMGS